MGTTGNVATAKSLRAHLQHEVASLYAFVESVSRACIPAPQSVAFPESSTRFFEHVTLLAEGTKKHIIGFERHADDTDDDFLEARTELWTLRAAWRELHQFIKPSADADTLNQPVAIVAALTSRVRELRGFELTDFAIFHTDSFDYSQVNPSATEDAVTSLAAVIKAKPFPTDLGLIGLPNSQGRAVFMNCLLAHEIGEYVYARRQAEPTIASEAKVALAKELGAAFTDTSETVQSRMTKTVLHWAKEVYCDLLAVRLVGPCYSFAYTELFDLPNLLDKAGVQIADQEDAKPQLESYRLYPSHPLRVKLQSELLMEEGWWDFVDAVDSRYAAVLRVLAHLDLKKFIEAEERDAEAGRAPFLKSLIMLIPEIKKLVRSATDGIDPRIYEYSHLWRPIGEYLRKGIVPSTLIIETEGTCQEVHPSPITLLNAAYRFYLEQIEQLMSGIRNQDQSSPESRSTWMKRVEDWTSKALEDVALLQAPSL
jgi:hypothetical protein